jgi:F-type H+-transporting ATPase subunit alpha
VEDVDEFSVKCLVFGEERFVKQGDRVRSDKRELKIPVTADLLGKVIESILPRNAVEKNDEGKAKWFKEKVDTTPKGKPKIVQSVADEILQLPIERTAPSITDRAQISDPMVTGVKAIDSMLPIGKGQRMLLIGDRSTGKTALAVDMIINQAKINKELNQDNPSFESHHKDTVYCIYVAIGKKVSEIKQLYNQLASKEKGDVNAMNYTIIIAATANDPAPLLYAAPCLRLYDRVNFQRYGEKTLLLFTMDLTKHANAYRQISLLLKRPLGPRTLSGDIFYLIQDFWRGSQINDKHTEVYVDTL